VVSLVDLWLWVVVCLRVMAFDLVFGFVFVCELVWVESAGDLPLTSHFVVEGGVSVWSIAALKVYKGVCEL
jgi:hypothetical protein